MTVVPGGDGHGAGSAAIDEHGFEVSIVIENLEPLVRTIANVHIALMVHLDRVHILELPGAMASRSEGLHKIAELVEFHDPLIVVSIGDENISGRIPSHIGFTVESDERSRTESLAASTCCRSGRRSPWPSREE